MTTSFKTLLAIASGVMILTGTASCQTYSVGVGQLGNGKAHPERKHIRIGDNGQRVHSTLRGAHKPRLVEEGFTKSADNGVYTGTRRQTVEIIIQKPTVK